ncbi:hypothetical protein F2Q68_00031112 [Brassica cretica]|uniref:Uncharacterized protein n=1 Tax=Brassica cretica TaxID=69181 RepID=A0A8S9GG16_BRACR|nr:hypothetical protein F2Q68_00031112 [Brassica cretica]
MESVAGRVSLSTRSKDGLKDRYGSDSCWTYVSLKIGQGMEWIEGLHKEQWIGSLICQTAALNSFTQLKDLGTFADDGNLSRGYYNRVLPGARRKMILEYFFSQQFRGIDRDPLELVRYAESKCQAWYNARDIVPVPPHVQTAEETQALSLGNICMRGPGAFPYRGPEGLGPAWRLEEMIPGLPLGRTRSLGLASLGSTQAGTYSEPRCVQAGESRRDDTGIGFLKISLVLRVPRTEGIGWFCLSSVMSGSKGDEALAEYKKALEAMSARKAAVKRTAPVEDEEVQFVGSSRRQVTAAVAPSSSKKKSKASCSVPKTPSPAPFDWSAVLSNLNAKAFPLVPARLSLDGDSFAAIRSLQGDLLQAASQLFHLGERMEDKTIAKAEVDALTTQLREGKDAVLAKEKEIKALKLKVQNQEEAMERVATENASLQKQLEGKEEDICKLKYAAEVFDAEKAMAINGAKVVAQWELMREWLHHQTDSWEPAAALEQYKTVKTTEAELLGLPAPCFDDEPQVAKRDGAPEPVDDPPTN